MKGIELFISKEIGSFKSRSYWILVGLSYLRNVTRPSELVLLVFCAAPQYALDSNPNGENAQTIITEWDLTGAKAWVPGFLQSVFYVGFMFGAIFFGQISDYFGRKNVLIKGYAILLAIIFSMGMAQNWQQLAVFRCLLGFTVGSSVVESIIFQEFCGSKLWVVNGVIVGGLAFTFNTLVYVVVAYYIPNWRTLCFVAPVPGLISFIYFYAIPESPRWLFSKGKIKEAEKAIHKFASWNGKDSGSDGYQLLIADETADDDTNDNAGNNSKEQKSVFDVMRHPLLRPRALVMGIQWFTASFVYYGITLGSGALSSNFYWANILSALSALPGIPFLIFLMENKRFGRRRTLLACNLLAATAAFLVYVIPQDDEKSSYRLVLLMLSKLGISSGFDLIYVYTPELFPTVVRNVGLGAMSTCARIGGIFAPFLANIMISSDAQTPFLLYGIFCSTCGVLTLFLPQTLGKTIPNTLEDLYELDEKE